MTLRICMMLIQGDYDREEDYMEAIKQYIKPNIGEDLLC